MLQKLKRKLVLICLLSTTALITFITLIALSVATKEINNNTEISLEKHLLTISEHLQNGIISHAWLAQLESDNHMIVDISVHDNSLSFPGSYLSDATRKDLLEKVYTLSHKYNPSGTGELIFHIDHYNTHYLCLVTNITCYGLKYRVQLIQDMTTNDHQLLYLNIIFISLIGFGILFLGLFSFWFVGKAIKPVEISQKEQVDFIAAASHELRSPLNVIQTTTDTLLLKPDFNEKHPIEIISSECHQLSRLIDDLLFLARSDAKHWQIVLSSAELDTLLLNIYESLLPVVESKNHVLTIDLPDDILPPIQMDSARITQVISILINNAITYTPDFSTIHLSISSDNDYLCVYVADNGPGIPDEAKLHIFKRFYRLDPSRHATNHYGLGLSIAYEIVRLHHGRLEVKDTEGGGATFVLQLPIYSS